MCGRRFPTGYESSAAYCEHVLEQAGVVITPGAVYGPAGEGWFRISLTTPDERLLEAVRAPRRARELITGRSAARSRMDGGCREAATGA